MVLRVVYLMILSQVERMRIFFYDDLCTIPTWKSGVQPVQVDSDETKKKSTYLARRPASFSLRSITTKQNTLHRFPPPAPPAPHADESIAS